MKKFLSGVLCATLGFSLAISALAISGRMTIEVDPVNVQVNGEVFAPTDVNGKEVPVFAYQGTTYAPLRALAEAYGLEVGYDAAANMATVSDPEAQPAEPDTTTNVPDYSDWSAEDEAAYQEFKGLWEYKVRYIGSGYQSEFDVNKDDDPIGVSFACISKEYDTDDNLREIVEQARKDSWLYRLGEELQGEYEYVTLWFYNDGAIELTEWGMTPGYYLTWFDCRY